jgi:16S rRNA (guanine966-N2)-methyltransferase
VLDLFAGTGAVGLEALSRGAASATFVERDRVALADIRANLDALGFEGGVVVPGDAFGFVARSAVAYDVIFSGPPQWAELWAQSLRALDARPDLLAAGGVVITQLDPAEDTGDPELAHLARTDQRTYGRTLLLFHEHQ